MVDNSFLNAVDSNELADEKISEEKGNQGFALGNYFFRSPVIYQRDLKRVIFKSWFYAGHVSEIPEKGDYFTFDVGEDSIIVARNKKGEIAVSANTCRHRGSRVCNERRGNTKSFICPYHAWVYDLSGNLIGARSMGEDFNKDNYGLKKIKLHVFEGMIFVNCDPHAHDLKEYTSILKPFIKPYRIEEAKVAATRTYTIQANWKLTLENYLECYHCGPSHKEYAKSHTLKDEKSRVVHLNEAMKKRAIEIGFKPEFTKTITNQYMDSNAFGCDISHMRYALYENFKTGSLDGMPVAPLMGDFQDYDGGAGDFQIGPLTFMLNYPDHCVLYRFLPKGLQESEVEIVWFVNGDAEEGKDYSVDRLIELWDFTTQEDKYIIMRNSEGVNSHFYEPGPYSPVFENLCMNFKEWYLMAVEE